MATLLSTIRRTVRDRLNETYALTTPGSPNVSPQGTPATKTISYAITATNATGESDASAATTITTGAATLTGVNFNRLTWMASLGATGYKVYRTATNGTSPTTTGLIGTATSPTFDDTGLAGDSAIAPTINTSGFTNPFWTEAELMTIIIDGCKDLWRAIIDLHQGHFTTIDATNVSLAASGTTLTGVPADCFRVLSLEPRDITTSSASRGIAFKPRPYKSASFQNARGQSAVSTSSSATIVFDILNAGSPVAAPSIVVAPSITTALNLRLVYTNTLSSALASTDNNPIPGESDNALVSWGVAWARAKEREDRSPDPSWIATYATDKQAILTALTPRQEQEEEVVEDMFSEYWS